MAGPRLRAFRGRILIRLLRVVAFIGRRIPLRVGRFIGSTLGELGTLFARRDRRRVLSNLAIAFPEWTDAQRLKTFHAMARHLGMLLFEIVWLPNLNKANLHETTITEGTEPIAKAVAEGRSFVAITGHVGNWEWLSYVIGLIVPLTALQRERAEPGLNDFIRELRLNAGVQTIDRGSAKSAREMLQALRKPGLLGFLIDQSLRAESAKVPFFGHPALTPIGPVKLAVRSGVPLLPLFDERLPDGRHRVRFLEPIETKPDDDPIELTARLTKIIEDQIRRAPEQWVWIHDRWRDRPKWDVTSRSASSPEART